MTDRTDKVNSLLQHELSKIIFRDFAFSPEILVTLTKVDTSSNMIEAKVHISVFPDDKADGVVNALDKSVYYIQHKINRVLKMRPVPKIRFVKDTDASKVGKIETIINQLKNEEK